MQQLAPPTGDHNPNGHTAATVRDALVGRYGSRRLSFRYELLDAAGTKVDEVGDLDNVIDGTITQNWLADIKRTARFTVRDTGVINFLSDRIKPWVRLHLPPYGADDWVEWPQGVFLLASPTRSADDLGVVTREVEAYDLLQLYADDLIEDRYTVSGFTTQTEDFEDASLTWSWSGTWTRQTGSVPTGGGTYAYKAADVAESGGSSSAVLTLPAGAREMTIRYRVSSESGFDYFEIWGGAADTGELLFDDSGDSGWSLLILDVADFDTITFRYIQDESVEELSATAWIDSIEITVDGQFYTTVIADLLGSDVESSIEVSDTPIPVSKEWPPGTSKLKIINELLNAINYESLSFDEHGVAQVQRYRSPQDRAIEYTYADDADGVVVPEVDQTLDLFDIPNKWVLVVSEPDREAIVGTYTNNDPGSPTSTVRRGRTITDFRTQEDAADQTTLDARAARLAFEASQVYEAIDFETALMPIHSGNDVYKIEYDPLAINARYAEHSWTMPLRAGAVMRHRARRVVTI